VNLLFKSYFKLNTLRLCKNISRPVEAKGLSTALPLGGMGEILTYQYYTGRVAMFEDNYEGAEKALMKAYKGAPKGCEKNKRMCLGYLIPVRMIRGCLPTEELLVKYGLKNVYWDIVEGMRTGNIRMFMQGLNNNQRLFISKGTYLLLEKCKVRRAGEKDGRGCRSDNKGIVPPSNVTNNLPLVASLLTAACS